MANSSEYDKQLLQLFLLINRLQLKAFNASSQEQLSFIIVNDTHQVFKYDRAYLFEIDDDHFELKAISGLHAVNKETELYQKSLRLLRGFKEIKRPQQLNQESFSDPDHLWDDLMKGKECYTYWLPIEIDGKLRLGMWIESDIKPGQEQRNPKDELAILYTNLAPSFAAAWAKFDKNRFVKGLGRNRKFRFYALLTALIVLFGVRVPLRVAAPFEVVADQPFVVTAPLDGIIDHVVVKPGQHVQKGELLFEYDRRVPEEEYRTTQKQVEVAREELNRAMTLGLADPKSLAEVQILKLKLQKEEIAHELAKTQKDKLDVEAGMQGVIVMDDPDEWRGRPVKVGERVLSISDPARTKIKIWVPESDNVAIDPEIPLQITLNVSPERNYSAKLSYIAFESQIGEGEVPAFQGEANWDQPHEEVKLGLRGTAILYGERVSLFYFIVRKPWSTFRHFTGI